MNIMEAFWTFVLLTCTFTTVYGNLPTLSQETVTDNYQNTADKDSKITWKAIQDTADYSADDVTYDPGSMKAFYDLTRSFVNNVFPGGMPWDAISKALNGTLITDVTTNYMDYAKQFAGWAVCIVIGFLFMIIFTLTGCIFCCCRCCGNCGGKMEQSKKNADAHCRRRTYAVILLVLVVFQLTGMICVFVSNDRFTTAIDVMDSTLSSNLQDIEVYFNQTVDQVKYVAENNFNFTLDVIFRDLDSIGYLAGIPIQTAMKRDSGYSVAISSAYTLATETTVLLASFSSLNTSINAVKDGISNLTSDMNGLKTNISNTKTTSGCCAALDVNTIAVNIDSSNFPNVDSQMDKISSVNSRNLTAVIEEAEADMNNIPNRVQDETNNTIASVKTDVRSFSDKLDPAVEEIEKLQKDMKVSDVTNDVSDYMTTAKNYDKYRWYGGIALACIILIIIALELLGLLFAVIGHDSKAETIERGCMSNSGGNMLMASVGFIFIFSWLLMLLTTLTFTLGSPMERFVCQPLTDPTLADLDKIVDEYLFEIMNGNDKTGTVLGNLLHNNTIDIPVSVFLLGCQAGKTSYTVLKMNETFNISAYTNFRSSLNFDETIKDVSTDVNLGSTTILTSDVQDQLNDLKTAADIDFESFRTELSKTLTQVNLTKLAEDLRTASGTVGSPGKEELLFHANQSEHIRDNSYKALSDSVDTMLTNLEDLEKAINGSQNANSLNLTEQVDQLIQQFNVTEQFIRVNGSTIISAEISTYTDRIFATVDSYVDDTIYALENEIGRCTPIWNLYNSLIVITLCSYGIDTLNGFWFSLGWVIFFFIPSVIFSVKLAKHYRKMKYVEGADSPFYEAKAVPEVRGKAGLSGGSNDVIPLSYNPNGNRVSPAGMSLTNVRTECPPQSRKSSVSSHKSFSKQSSSPSLSRKSAHSQKGSVLQYDEKPHKRSNKVAHADLNEPAIGYSKKNETNEIASEW